MAKFQDLSESILDLNVALKSICDDENIYRNDDSVLEFLILAYKTYYSQIHEFLVSKNTQKAEEQILYHLRNVDKYFLPFIEKKINSMEKKIDYVGKYLSVYDDFYALVAFRSLKHFALYSEWGEGGTKKTHWRDTLPVFGGFWHYAGKMVLGDEFQFIEKQFPTGYGKCVDENTIVRTPNGNIRIKDINVGDNIYSMKDNKLCVEKVIDKTNTFKSQITIKTRGGIPITVSPEHRLLTQNGYKEAQNITKDDYLYRQCCIIDNDTKNEIPQEEFEFITLMIFEGHCKSPVVGFSQQNNLVLKQFKELCEKLNLKYSIYNEKNSKSLNCRILVNKGKTKALLEKYGISNESSYTKRLPKCFFTMPLKQKYKFISLMLATDGYIGKLNKNYRGGNTCAITLANKELIYDIQAILDSCGIYSTINQCKKNYGTDKKFDAWTLTIPNEYLHIIYNNCYCYDKQIELENKMNILNSYTIKTYSNCTNYPKEIVRKFKSVRKYCNKQFARNKTFKKEIISKIYENDKSLEEIIYKDFVWEKITVIEKNEIKIPMIDISVSNTNNFIANGIVSHNSYSDAVLMAFIFGNNISDDCLKVFGASENVSTFTMGLVDIMITPLYMKVFPYYKQFECDSDKMFSIKQIKDTGSKLRITGSPKINLRVVSKDKNTNGVRARWLFLDDITQLVDAYNINAHKRDIFKLVNEWFKRNYNLTNFKVVVGGTTYSNEDILSWLLIKNNIENSEIAKEKNRVVNKYTRIANSNYILENGKSVFVCVPKLDWDTDESTFPSNFPTETARRTRAESEDGGRMFEAMEQQRPLPSETTPFCYENIKTYNELPLKESEGGSRSNYCTAAIDLPRTGKNNLSMPVLSNCNGIDYVVDFLYEKVPLDYKFEDGSDTIDIICRYIIMHRILSLIVETNTNSNIDTQIIERLKNKYNWLDTKIFPTYSTEKKEEKIYSVQGTILSSYRFPSRNLVSPNSMMGKAMRDIITWDGKPNKPDDSIDSIAIHCKKYHKRKQGAQVEILKRRNW